MFATIHLPARLQPLDRGDVFEDPLDAWLDERGFGGVIGGGTAYKPGAEIESCDIELELTEIGAGAVAEIIAFLEAAWAPKGSVLRIEDQSYPLGRAEGAALYLNGTDLAPEVYAANDPMVLIGRIEQAIAGKARLMSHWEGPTETALYIYGDSFAEIAAILAPIIADSPECEKSRLVQIA